MAIIEKQHYEIDHPVVRLASLWQRRMTALHGHFPKPLTPKELGQLKTLKKSLGDLTGQVIDWALNNWGHFSHEARAQAGLSSAPAAPHIGFFLKYHCVAVNLMYAIAKSKTAKSAAEMCFIDSIDTLIAKQKQELEEELAAMSEQ